MAPKRSKGEYFQLTQDDRAVIKKLEILTQAVEKVYPSIKGLMWRSLLQGLFVAIGLTIGLSLIFGLVTYILVQTKKIPVFKQVVPQEQIEKLLPEE